MSFYNVANPTSFSIVSDVRKLLVQPGKLTRFPQTQYFTGTNTLTAEQLVAGNIIVGNTAAGTVTLTLPSPTDLITLLMGPGGFDVSSSDIFSFTATNISASGNLVIVSGGTGTSKTITGTAVLGVTQTINLQISVSVSGGTTTYGYAML